MPAAHARAAVTAHGVDLVDEDDRRRVGLGLLEEVAHAAGADAHEHLDEVGARDRVEGHPGLAGDGAREERLAGAGRAVQEHTLGDLGADGLELGRLGEELLDLTELLDRLVAPGDVGERGLRGVLGHELGLGLAELHDAAATALHAAHEPEQDQHDQQDRQEREEQGHERVGGGVLDVEALELLVGDGSLGGLHEARPLVAEPGGPHLLVVLLEGRLDLLLALDERDRLDLVVLEVLDHRGRLDLAVAVGGRRELEDADHDEGDDDDPEPGALQDLLDIHGASAHPLLGESTVGEPYTRTGHA